MELWERSWQESINEEIRRSKCRQRGYTLRSQLALVWNFSGKEREKGHAPSKASSTAAKHHPILLRIETICSNVIIA